MATENVSFMLQLVERSWSKRKQEKEAFFLRLKFGLSELYILPLFTFVPEKPHLFNGPFPEYITTEETVNSHKLLEREIYRLEFCTFTLNLSLNSNIEQDVLLLDIYIRPF